MLSLTNDTGFFNEFVLECLSLEELLRLPCVCKQLRNNTNSLGTWYSLLLEAMIRRRRLMRRCVTATQHDNAVKLFFGIPMGWKIPPLSKSKVDGKSYFYGIAEIKVAALAANGPIYKDLRNEIQLAIDDYTKNKCALQNSIDGMMGSDITLKASLLVDSEIRVRSAANAMIAYNSTVCDEIRMHPCSVFKFEANEFTKWAAFAGCDAITTYKPSPRPWVLDMIKASDLPR